MEKGIAIGLVFGIAFLIIGVIISLVIVSNVSDIHTSIDTSSTSNTSSFLGANASTLNFVGTPISSSATRKNDTWLEFDGVDDFIRINESLNVQTGNFTYSVWFYLNTLKAPTAISDILQIANSSSNNDIWLEVYNDTTNLTIRGNTYSTAGSVFTKHINDSLINKWVYLTYTYNGTGSYMYVDSLLVEQNLTAMTRGSNLNDRFSIGAGNFNPAVNHWNGSFDEIRLYNVSLNQSQITEIYNSERMANDSLPSAGLVFWFSINENSGIDVNSGDTTYSDVITGATWQDDGVDITLTEDVDYSITGKVFKIINNNLAWSSLSITYAFRPTTAGVNRLTSNLSSGIDNVSSKIPTVLLIGMIVVILGILAILVGAWQKMKIGGGI